LPIVEKKEGKSKTVESRNKLRIKNNTILIINTIIQKPVFDTQLKETLKSPPKSFEFDLSDAFLKQVSTSGIVEQIMGDSMQDLNKQFAKQGGKKSIKITWYSKVSGCQ